MRFYSSRLHRALACSAIALAASAIGATVNAHEAPQLSATEHSSGELAEMVCPVTGDSTFSDSWGDARSSGRRHEGVDMAATRGTPVVATLAGLAEFKNTSAGGRSVWLTTPDGDKFFYAHLDRWEGVSREVAQRRDHWLRGKHRKRRRSSPALRGSPWGRCHQSLPAHGECMRTPTGAGEADRRLARPLTSLRAPRPRRACD